MKRITPELFDRITLNASLQRLGVVELTERLEFSPLLVEGGLQEPAGPADTMCCVCKIPEEWPQFSEIHVHDPVGDSLNSTGPTDGGLIR